MNITLLIIAPLFMQERIDACRIIGKLNWRFVTFSRNKESSRIFRSIYLKARMFLAVWQTTSTLWNFTEGFTIYVQIFEARNFRIPYTRNSWPASKIWTYTVATSKIPHEAERKIKFGTRFYSIFACHTHLHILLISALVPASRTSFATLPANKSWHVDAGLSLAHTSSLSAHAMFLGVWCF